MYSNTDLENAVSNQLCELIILPTEKCNFRCTYCYEDFQHGKMNKETIRRVKAFINRRSQNLKHLIISWFGGEPLLAKDVVLEITNHAKELSEEREFSLIGGLTTNAYLLDAAVARELSRSHIVNHQITIDGDQDWHDQTRLTAKKSGSFDRIMSNLFELHASDITFNASLRLHVHRENVESISRIYLNLREKFKDDARFSFFFHKVSDLGIQPSVKILGYDEYAKIVRNLLADTHNPLQSQNVSSEIHQTSYICYAAKPNSLVIRSNGRINKCTVALSSSKNDIGHIDEHGGLVLDQEKLRPWFKGFGDLQSNALSCPLHFI